MAQRADNKYIRYEYEKWKKNGHQAEDKRRDP